MRIDNLNQYGTYRLVFPLTVNGLPVSAITDAKFEIRDSSGVLLSLSLEENPAEVSFTDSKIHVVLNSINTVELISNYTYEMWVKLSDNKPYIVRSGTILFNKTTVRF